jgi:hypothetical protein
MDRVENVAERGQQEFKFFQWKGQLKRKPWNELHSSRTRQSRCSSVSTPSAMTDKPMALPREMMDCAMAQLLAFSTMSRTKERSIFNWSSGKRFR